MPSRAFQFSSCSQGERGAGNAAPRRCLHLSPLALRPERGANPVGRRERRGTLKSPAARLVIYINIGKTAKTDSCEMLHRQTVPLSIACLSKVRYTASKY